MVNRKNTFEIFGFDFMVDENYRVWLIEVNSSPTMEYSTALTTQLVKKGMSELGDLVNNYIFKGKHYEKSKARELYGGWTLLTGM
jgi:tubulin monoglycylase TTLL3/8